MTLSAFVRIIPGLLALLVLPIPLSAQSALRGWGMHAFDTEALHGSIAHVLSGGADCSATAIIRADGRLFVWGSVVHNPPTLLLTRPVRSASITRSGVALLQDGTLEHWGISQGATPATDPNAPWVAVAAGDGHALALRSNGTIAAWGSNWRGQVNVPPLASGLYYTAVAASGTASAAVVSDGTARFWGWDPANFGPVPSLPPARRYLKIAIGARNVLALRDDHEIIAFGDNSFGQCNVPPLPPNVTYTDMAGSWHGLALRSDGNIVAWGSNSYGQCNVPPLPPGTRYIQLAAGEIHSVALRSDGELVTWGDAGKFQGRPPSLTPNHRFVDVAIGSNHALAVDSSGKIHHWGTALHGMDQIPLLPPSVRYEKVAVSIWHCMALSSDGRVSAWGENSNGRCNVPPLPQGLRYEQIACSYGHSAVLRSDGQVLAFGSNLNGECTIPPLPPNTRYVEVACGQRFTLLRRSDGVLIPLGGIAPDGRLAVPSPPPGVEYVQISVGEFSGSALRSDGLVDTWGSPADPTPQPPSVGVYCVEVACCNSFLFSRWSDGSIQYHNRYVFTHLSLEPRALLPGTTYQKLAGGFLIIGTMVGPTSTYVSFAPGCAGSLPAARIIPRDTPKLGQTLRLRLDRLPQHHAYLAFGWQQLANPIDLTNLGMPGCAVQISLDAVALVAGQHQQAVYELPIPNQPAMVGLRFHHQAFVPDSGALNPLLAVVSDAATAVVGF